MHDALVGRAAEAVLLRLLPGLVEVGPDDALRVRARQRVAREQLLDEQRLAVDEVVAVVLELAARQRDDARTPPGAASGPFLRSWRGILLAGGAARARPGLSGAAAARRSAALGGRDHRARDAVPGVALARDADDRRRGSRRAGSAGASSHDARPSASWVTACGPTSNVSHGRDLGRHRRGERAGDLRHARVAGDDRQRAARGRLGRDHPERLRERARHRERLGRGEHVGELRVLEPARPVHACRRCRAAAAR